MSQQQQYQPQQSGGRGGRGGRGGGYNNNNNGNYAGGGRGQQRQQQAGGASQQQQQSMGAWQPAAPTSTATPTYAQQPPQQQQPPRGGPVPGYGPPPAAYYNPYATQQGPPGYNARGQYQPAMGYGPPRGGGVFYPPPQSQAPPGGQQPTSSLQQAAAKTVPPAPREKKPLVITDKDGNVIDFSSMGAKKPKPASSLQAAAASTASPTRVTPEPGQDAGAKLRQAALERLGAEDKAKKEAEDKEKQEADEKKQAEEQAKKEAEEKAKKESEEKAKKEAEEQAKKEAEEQAKKEAEEKAKKEAEEKARKEAEETAKKEAAKPAQRPSFSAMASKAPSAVPPSTGGRLVYDKAALQKFSDIPYCKERPDSLPDMEISKYAARQKSEGGGRRGSQRGGGGGDGGGGGSEWSRGNAPPRRQSSSNKIDSGGGGGGGEWSRGQAPPRQQNRNRGGRGGRGGQQPLYDGPVAPLVKSENHWRPTKNTSALIIAEKQVKAILNKMTKEKFEKLATQMCEIPISSYEIMNMMIKTVFDKAIDEPHFGDIYAHLCHRLSHVVKGGDFVHIIESDEEPPTEGAESAPDGGESTSYTVYRWSNDVSTSDSEIVGPFSSAEECVNVALDQETEQTPVERGEMLLDLSGVSIKSGTFIKIMKKKDAEEGEESVFFTVFFPVNEAEECGQQLSKIFLSQLECQSDATKKNSFRSSLLNKCEEEFKQEDIYVEWKKEKKEYDESKSSLTPAERKEKEGDLEFRRMQIKKHMLGNVKFIGQLYKAGLLKERVMRFCIASLLKLEGIEDSKGRVMEYKDTGDMDIDEEDHEALCSMFSTVGATLDQPHAQDFMALCFSKIDKWSVDKSLPARSRFMYKDLIDLRDNNWVPRRKVEKAKTLEEIRKDVEREERRSSLRGSGKGDFRGGGDKRGGGRQQSSGYSGGGNRPKPAAPQTDEDGFTVIAKAPKSSLARSAAAPSRSQGAPSPKKSAFAALADDTAPATASDKPEPLSDEKFGQRLKSMRMDYLADRKNVSEVLLSMDELSGTPDAGVKVVSMSADRLLDAKEDERRAIDETIAILFEKKRLSEADVKNGLVDAIEFVDSSACDSPLIYQYLGELFGPLLRLGAIDFPWLAEQLEKTKVDPKTQAPEKLIRHSIVALKASGGADMASQKAKANEQALTKVLGADVWSSISAKEL